MDQVIQNKMQNMLNEIVESGRDLGMQLVVYHNDEMVVNAFAGVADSETKVPVTENTLFPAFSTGKGITATMLNILADRGVVDYDQPVCDFWPGFAKHGKDGVLIRHALSHSSGIPQIDESLSISDICDWEGMCRRMEDTKPLWGPGERTEYHPMTYGWIIGRIIELASNMSFADFLKKEINIPLKNNDMYIGIPDDVMDSGTVATLYEPGFDPAVINASGIITIPKCCIPMVDALNNRQVLQSCMPGVNGTMSAMFLARHYASLLPCGVDGIKLLSDKTVKIASHVWGEEDKPDPHNVFGLGYAIGTTGNVVGSRNTLFGHGGYGGTVAFSDLENNFAMGITKNFFSNKSAELEIIRTVQQSLGISPDPAA